MPTLEEVTDYRELLRQFYDEHKRKMPLYSYRMMGDRLGLDASQLFRILQKEQHLPPRCVPQAKALLGLAGRHAEHFDLLIAAARTRSATKRKVLHEQIFALRDVQRRQLDEKQLRFLRQWWNAGLRALLEVTEGRAEPRDLSRRLVPSIPETQVAESLALLQELGLVKKVASGRLVPAETHLTVGGPERAQAVHQFQLQALRLAADSLESFPHDQRDLSTLTMSMDAECYEDVRGMLKEFRRQVQKRVEDSPSADRVMLMTLAFHPIAPPATEST